MTNPQIQQNLIPNEVQLKDLLDLHEKSIGLKFNCHHVGIIQSFDPETQTAVVSIAYKKTFFQPDPVTGVYAAVLQDYPLLADCPVYFPGGGGFQITFPVEEGDECFVAFNDRDIDNWYQTGNTSSPVATPRLHSISDAIAFVGLNSSPNVLDDFNEDGAELRNEDGTNTVTITDDDVTIQKGDTTIVATDDSIVATVGSGITFEIDNSGKVKITNETGELITALFQLFTDVQAATAGGFPLIMPTFPDDLLVLESFKS